MVDFSDREEVEAWLRTQPREVAVACAASAAGLVLPALARTRRMGLFVVINSLRACAIALASGKHLSRERELLLAAAKAAADATAVGAANAFDPAVSQTAYSAANAAATASTFGAYASTNAAAAIANAAAVIDNIINDSSEYNITDRISKKYYNKISFNFKESDRLLGNQSLQNRSVKMLWKVDAVLDKPALEHQKILKGTFISLWRELKSDLISRSGENWEVWTDWYDAWLDGREQFPSLSPKSREDLDIAICLIPDEDWKKGPAHVNAVIKGMIEEALKKAERETPPAEVPPQQVAAILPIWSDGVLVQDERPVAEGRPAVLLDAALSSLRETMRKLADDFDKWVAECVAKGRDPQVDRKPADHLRDVAAMIADETPSLGRAFEIFHARDALAGMVAGVKAEWPDPLAARFAALLPLFDRVSKLSPEWQELMGTPSRPTRNDIIAAPQAVEGVIEILEDEATAGLVAPSLVERLKRLAAPLATAVAAERPEPFGPELELLAIDVVNSVDNIIKRLAEAGVEVMKLGGKAGKELWTGFRVNVPKEAKKLGAKLAKVAVWGAALGGGGWLAAQFEWFGPIWQVIKPFLK